MKSIFICVILFLTTLTSPVFAQAEATADAEQKRAAEWIATLQLTNADQATRVIEVVTTHLKAVRDWHNEHPATSVPAGINPITGKKLNEIEREVIADSTLPKSVHDNLMTGLRKDLTEAQVASVLDKYTVGKVAFTMKGYHGIMPDLTVEEEKMIREHLEKAREEAVDYKNMKEISTIFKIHKTQIEQSLNDHGRDWKKLYKEFTAAIIAKKKAGTETNAVTPSE